MANYLTTDTDLTAVADAIRTKGGTSAPLEYPDEFVSAIEAINVGPILPTYTVYWDDTGELDYVVCDMTYTEIMTIIGNNTYCDCFVKENQYDYGRTFGATCDYNQYDDDHKIVINVMSPDGVPYFVIHHFPNDTKTISFWDYNDDSDMYVIDNYVYAKYGYYQYDAGIPMPSAPQATPTIAFSSNGLITATAVQTSGYVSAGTKTSTYSLTTRSAADMTVNGSYVTAPSGYYSEAFSKAVSAGSAFVANSQYTEYGGVTVTYSTGALNYSTSISRTITGVVTSGYISSIANGTFSIDIRASGQLPILAATTYTPTTTIQRISSYQWLTGSQTILGDANLLSSNIKSNVSIFGVTGTYSGESITYYVDVYDAEDDPNNYVLYNNTQYHGGDYFQPIKDDTITIHIATSNSYKVYLRGELVSTSNNYVYTVWDSCAVYFRTDESGTSAYISEIVIPDDYKSGQYVTPTTYDQVVARQGDYLNGNIIVDGDGTLISENIKSGVSIFGVSGTMEGLPSSITYLPETTIVATSYMNTYPLPDLIPFNAVPVDIIINGITYGPDRQDWIGGVYGNVIYVYKTTSKGEHFASFNNVNGKSATCAFVENGTYTCKIVYHPFEETEYGNTLISNKVTTGTISSIGYTTLSITCDNTADKAIYPYFEVTIGNVTKIIRALDPYKCQFGNYYINQLWYYSDSDKTISFMLYGEAESTYNLTITIKGIRKYKDTTSVVNGTGIIDGPMGGSYYNVSALEYIKIDRLQEEALVSRMLTSFTNNTITTVGTGAFYYHTTRLESVYLPKVRIISTSAFYYCQALTTMSLPNCSRIDNYAFFSAFSIGASLDLPNLTSMSNYAFGYARLGTINIPLLNSIPSMCFSNCYYLTSFSAPECRFISDAAFRFCSSLTEAVLPKVSHIGSQAFGNCYSLSYISAPECLSLGWSVFYSCSNLTQVYIPKVTNIGGSCFYNCSLITSLNFPSCVSIAQGAFINCSGVTSISLSLCEILGQSVFSRCYALSSIDLPACTSIGTYGFAYCSSLTSISIPNVTFLGGSAFLNCINLPTISISKCSLFYAYTFGSCYNLLSLYLLNSSVTVLSNVNAFNSTPISTYTTSTSGINGSIYVPASLYNSYITATNWINYSSRFVSLTDAEIAALIS